MWQITRTFLGAVAGLLIAGCGAQTAPHSQAQLRPDMKQVRVCLLDSHGNLGEPVLTPKVVKTDQEWRKQLTAEQYQIARGKGTESPFCGIFYDHKKPGYYTCVCCGLPLFPSAAKFDSGTGWPSFFTPIAPENVSSQPDLSHGMRRTEVLCTRCDAHLGHVFEDGPKPSGLRYCLNSASLVFTETTTKPPR
jgi:methionine-R-sulfoxide reductase